jgi:hypothetical protein
MRRAPLALAVTFIALAVVLAAVSLRPPSDIASPSPSPSPSASPTATATASAAPTATATPSPSPTPQGLYLSKRLGFALTLPPPWRKAGCGNTDPGRTEPPYVEQFTSAPVMEEHIGHAGSGNDRVEVLLDNNPDGLTPTQFAQRRFRNDPITPVTFAGRPAVEVRTTRFGDVLTYIFAEGDRIYAVSALSKTSAAPDIQTMLAILRSFRLLSSAERLQLPDPAPIPAAAPTAEALAGMLKTAFERKDMAVLERVLGPCISQGVVPGGGASEPRERFVAELRQQLAAGLAVTVDTSSIATVTRGPTYTYVWSKWNAFPPGGGAPPESPRPQTFNVQLIFGETQGGFYWSGTLLVHTF